jgi:hypothetical protein
MSPFYAWIESLRKLSSPPAKVRFQHADGSDYELPLETALALEEPPPPGMRCSAVVGERETVHVIPRPTTPKEDLSGARAYPALVKAVAESVGMALVQVVPVFSDLRETLRSLSAENAELRTQLNEANRLVVERGLESVLATSKEKELEMRAQHWDKVIAIGGRVADGLMVEHSRSLLLRRALLGLKPSTVQQIQTEIGEANFAEIAELLFAEARAMGGPSNDGGSAPS